MGTPKEPENSLLFIGTLYSKSDYYYESLKFLKESFGEIIMEGPEIRWDYSDYYKKELGNEIFRRFIFFKDLIRQHSLPDIKLKTNDIEMKLSINGKRNINLDPGYLTFSKIILASTKDYSHRIYLRDGIFAEVTLSYNKKEKRFCPNLNTYKDFTDNLYTNLFLTARKLYSYLLKGGIYGRYRLHQIEDEY